MGVEELLNNSFVVLDKPPGHSSHEITAFARKILKSKKAGHSGTLDPNVSGVLLIALGRATKLLQFVAGKRKKYVCIIKFKNRLSDHEIENLFSGFVGEITQIPPEESAVRKVPRKRKVYYIKILERKNNLVLFETEVDAGTYIRTLCTDAGKKAGGARMVELRRIAVEEISESSAVKIQDLTDAMWLWENSKDDSELKKLLVPIEKIISFPRVVVRDSAVNTLLSGAQLMVPGIDHFPDRIKKDDVVSIYSNDGEFIGVGRSKLTSKELGESKKGIAVAIIRIHKIKS